MPLNSAPLPDALFATASSFQFDRQHIQECHKVLASLLEDEESFLRFISSSLGLLRQPSPIRTLPLEILLEIFSYHIDSCIRELAPNTTNLHGHTLRSIQIAQNRLVHVCRLWRYAAFSAPRLWTVVALKAPAFMYNYRNPWHQVTPPTQLEFADYWSFLDKRISFAGSLPLSVFYTAMDSYAPSIVIERIIHIVLNLLPRTRQLVFRTMVYSGMPSIAHGKPSSQVQSLCLDLRFGDSDADSVQWANSFCSLVPNLHALHVKHGEQVLYARNYSFLQELTLRSITVEFLVSVFRNIPSLKTFRASHVSGPPLVNDAMVRHEALTRFLIRQRFPSYLFMNVTFPSLQHLSLSRNVMGEGSLPWPSPDDLAFFSRSECLLCSLSLQNTPINENIGEVLRSQHRLNRLVLSQRSSSSTIIPQLLTRKPVVVPMLKHLTIAVTSEQLPELVDMLTARHTQSKKRKVVQLKECNVTILGGFGTTESSLMVPFMSMRALKLTIHHPEVVAL